MAFFKFAAAEVLLTPLGMPDAHIAKVGGSLVKDSHRHAFNYDPRPGYLYVRSRAISSRCNDNFDEFPAEEIKAAYATFKGKPVFVNHHNDNHRRARGVIVDAALHEDVNPDGSPDTWCEVLMEVDAIHFPMLAQAIIKGEVDRTSMGTDVKFSVCSACGNKAETPLDYCEHIPRLKGKKIVRRNAATGAQETVLIREICHGLGFFENSLLVEEPADPTAFTFGVDARGLSSVASLGHTEARGDAPVAPPKNDRLTDAQRGYTQAGASLKCNDCDHTDIADMIGHRNMREHVGDVHRGRVGKKVTASAAHDDDNAYAIHHCHHTSLGRILDSRGREAAANGDDWEQRWDKPDEGAPVPEFMTKGAHEYRAKHNLTHLEHGGFDDIVADKDRAHELSTEYDKLPHSDPAAHKAYKALGDEVHAQFKHLTHRMGVKVEFTDEDPYKDHHEMAADLANNKRLRVLRTSTTVGDSGAHPMLSNRQNDEFRAVHDAFGHAATGRPFDRHGEEAAWASHAGMFSPLARSAMTTETRGQNSSLIMNGHFPEQKAGILPKKFWDDDAVSGVKRVSRPTTARKIAAEDPDADIRNLSPEEFDTKLAGHHAESQGHGRTASQHLDHLHILAKDDKERRRGGGWKMSHEDVLNTDPSTTRNPKQFEETKAKFHQALSDKKGVDSEISRHNNVFGERGGWSRFFLVPDGHIHSSTACHSCRSTTPFSWLPHLSGKSEKDAVDMHGPHLCTHCFKSAPTEWKQDPTKTRSDEKKKSGEYCEGGTATILPQKEIARRQAEHPQGKLKLNDGEAYGTYGRSGRFEANGKCPTCKTLQSVKGNGEFYNHKPPAAEKPKPEAKPIPDLPHPTDKNIKTHLRQKHQMTTHDIESVTSGQWGPPMTLEEAHKNSHSYDKPDGSGLSSNHRHASRKLGYGEVVAPPEVDTLRDDICPVCGEKDSYNGDECMVCDFHKPPQMFMDPDVDVARQIDLRQDQNAEDSDADTLGDTGDLLCPNCGSQFNSDDADGDGIDENPDPGDNDADAEHADDQDPYNAEPAEIEQDPDPYGMQLPEDVPGQQAPEDPEEDEPAEGQPPYEDPETEEAAEQDEAAEDVTSPQEGDTCPNCGKGTLTVTDSDPSQDDEDDDDPDEDDDEDGDRPAPPFTKGSARGRIAVRMTYGNGSSKTHYAEEGSERAYCGAKVRSDGEVKGRRFVDCQKCDQIGEKRNASLSNRPQDHVRVGHSNQSRRELVEMPQPQKRRPAPTKRTASAPAPRRDLHSTLARMAAVQQAQSLALQMQARQIQRIAALAGVENDMQAIAKHYAPKFTALRKQADEDNPAQPIPSPAAEPAAETTEEALAPAGRDDVQNIGASPVTDVSADAVTSVDEPFGEVANEPLDLNEQDVTAPVEGTDEMRPPDETITYHDVQVGDPDRPETAFPLGGVFAEPATASKSQGRTYASLRLAKLRLATKIATGDELVVAQQIDSSKMTDAAIASEIETIGKIVSAARNAASPAARTASRRLVPQAAQGAQRVNPSMAQGAVGTLTTAALVPNDDEFMFEG